MTDDRPTIAEQVAAACNLPITVRENSKVYLDYGEFTQFCPAESPSDAVIAADAYGLLHTGRYCAHLEQWYPREWVVMHEGGAIGRGTFCEAICQAILFLDERRAR